MRVTEIDENTPNVTEVVYYNMCINGRVLHKTFNCTRAIGKISVPAIKTKFENSRYISNVHIILC